MCVRLRTCAGVYMYILVHLPYVIVKGYLCLRITINTSPLSVCLLPLPPLPPPSLSLSLFLQIFFQPKYIQDHPEEKEGVEELRSLIVEQVGVACY